MDHIEEVYSRDQIAAEFPGVPKKSDSELLRINFQSGFRKEMDWRNYVSIHDNADWLAMTSLTRLITYIRAFEEAKRDEEAAMREEWD